MSATLFVSGVAASFGARSLFSGLDATVAPGDVTALVGANGAGKTTLLRIVAGEWTPDAGVVRLAPPGASVGYLPQSLPDRTESILGYVGRRTGVSRAQAAFEDAAGRLADDPHAAETYDHALATWLALGGADLEARLAGVLADLDLDADLDRPLGSLSGGQAARAALASILVSRYDVLLLDEPTNNLDADGLTALTGFVQGLGSPVLVASHDRAFLDAVATSVIELDEAQQQVNHYAGGWSDYRAAKQVAREQAHAAYATYADTRDSLIEQARRKDEWARQGRAKAARLGAGMKLEKKFREDRARRMDQRAARVRDAVERLEEVEQPRKEWELRFTIAEAPPSAEVVLTLDRLVAHNGDFMVGPLSAQVVRGERVALVGPNGSGKTTMLQAVLGERPAAHGRISWGTRVRLGVLDQARDVISGERTLLDVVADRLGRTDLAAVRTLLAKFGLGAEQVGRPCDSLSLGERTRAALALLQGREVNVLALDEPTNHLDAAAIDQLQDALVAFDGTLLIVTHDRALLDALAPVAVWEFPIRGSEEPSYALGAGR
ncbi:ABC-F family ATP-binding cassette domain-containing protein [Micropruina sonneratiae]|uniref:ABC-F family ATP-binding cassette domain-containing protein n=1 Tax=Micropruina sonneratiae TaxID=2986940 RepID=UPI00222702D3|nr:ABC-F family ATP-binding cassette domain-containing protein [Micropruina sp. KQZ13P-5]MCW3159036.1 ATP-binding cassette domain-containing protein [Micropruina sp. KQZ13P-5]